MPSSRFGRLKSGLASKDLTDVYVDARGRCKLGEEPRTHRAQRQPRQGRTQVARRGRSRYQRDTYV